MKLTCNPHTVLSSTNHYCGICATVMIPFSRLQTLWQRPRKAWKNALCHLQTANTNGSKKNSRCRKTKLWLQDCSRAFIHQSCCGGAVMGRNTLETEDFEKRLKNTFTLTHTHTHCFIHLCLTAQLPVFVPSALNPTWNVIPTHCTGCFYNAIKLYEAPGLTVL